MSDAPELGTWRFDFGPGRLPLVVRNAREDESAGDPDHVVMRNAQGQVVAKVPRGTYQYLERVTDDEPAKSQGFKPTSQVLEDAGIPAGLAARPTT